MKIIKPTYKIRTKISDGGIEELKFIEAVGRECYQSADVITQDGSTAKMFVKMLIDRGHEAMLEHSQLSVMFAVDRGVSHELVRHRIASFAQESTRYCNYSKGKFGGEITVVSPEQVMRDRIGTKVKVDGEEVEVDIYRVNEWLIEWAKAVATAEEHYMALVNNGCPPELARSVLPHSVKTSITITANYREWRNFFKLRAADITGKAHPQMKEVTVPLLSEVQSLIPVVFDDIVLPE